jgi:hypothetical protein
VKACPPSLKHRLIFITVLCKLQDVRMTEILDDDEKSLLERPKAEP